MRFSRKLQVANNGEIMRDATIAGLGLAMLPVFMIADALAAGHPIDAMPDSRPVPDPIYAAYPKMRHPPKKLKALLAHLQASLGGESPWEQALRVRRSETAGLPKAG